jgi:hypothetical protein
MVQVLGYNVDEGLERFSLSSMTHLLTVQAIVFIDELCSAILLVIFMLSDTVTEML